MKKLVCTILLAFSYFFGHSQDSQADSLKMKKIDSIVAAINQAEWRTRYDTAQQDAPGMKMTTFLTTVEEEGILRKFINNVRATSTENGVSKETNTYNIFYFDQQQLIKVEERGIMRAKKVSVDWYYENGKPLVRTYKSEKSTERAFFLAKLGQQLLEQYTQLR